MADLLESFDISGLVSVELIAAELKLVVFGRNNWSFALALQFAFRGPTELLPLSRR